MEETFSERLQRMADDLEQPSDRDAPKGLEAAVLMLMRALVQMLQSFLAGGLARPSCLPLPDERSPNHPRVADPSRNPAAPARGHAASRRRRHGPAPTRSPATSTARPTIHRARPVRTRVIKPQSQPQSPAKPNSRAPPPRAEA